MTARFHGTHQLRREASSLALPGQDHTVAAAYYNRLADALARTVISDKLVVKDGTRTWPFKGKKGQARPTVDAKGILNEPCDSKVSDWPYGCNLGHSAGLPHFGFLWDSPNANKPVIFATQVSVLDGLNAAMTGSYAMC